LILIVTFRKLMYDDVGFCMPAGRCTMKSNRSPRGYWLFVLLAAAVIASILIPSRTAAQSNSQARIVRLSFVEGTVTMYRPDADQWAKVFVNTPIQQGFKIATDANSFAEVEFENGSTARMGQSSELDFSNLSLSPEGSKINHLTLAQGYATFAVVPDRGDVYRISAAGSTFDATSKTMFRVDLDQSGQRLEVFKGDVNVEGPYGSGRVARNQVLALTPGNATPFQITDGVTEDAWDQWVDKRQQTDTVASNKAGPGDASLYAGSSLYGWNDLSYYGAWNYLPGSGSCWSPMMGAGWTPYSVGRWSWYPGFGYTWISGLPWGWLPFHYGSWIYPADMGWCWLPGGFSNWSPGLVTWYQGPGWVSWTPRAYTGSFNMPVNCPAGQNCSVAVSSNTFQGGRPISPNDVIRVNPFRGHAVGSPTVPLTRNLRLPGPGIDGSPQIAATGTGGSAGLRIRHGTIAPTRIFATGNVSGAWDVQPHAPAVYNQQTRRFVNRSGPVFQSNGAVTPSSRSTINNDMLLRGRAVLRGGNSGAQLTSIPISSLGTNTRAMRHSNSLMPSAHPAGMQSFQASRMPDFRQERMLMREQKMENARARKQMEQMNRRSGMSQQRMERGQPSRGSSGGFGAGRSTGQSSGQMGGGMRSGGMGGGMTSSGSSSIGGNSGGGMRGGNAGGGPHH
jgi:Family of unknown function (DUF6600)/FecR protein